MPGRVFTILKVVASIRSATRAWTRFGPPLARQPRNGERDGLKAGFCCQPSMNGCAITIVFGKGRMRPDCTTPGTHSSPGEARRADRKARRSSTFSIALPKIQQWPLTGASGQDTRSCRSCDQWPGCSPIGQSAWLPGWPPGPRGHPPSHHRLGG